MFDVLHVSLLFDVLSLAQLSKNPFEMHQVHDRLNPVTEEIEEL